MSGFWQRPEENKYGNFVAQSKTGKTGNNNNKEPANNNHMSGTSPTSALGSQEWSAWGEYLGTPRNGDFVEWKKQMVEGSMSGSETNEPGKTTPDDQATNEKQKENKPCGKEMPEKHKKQGSMEGN